jgi:hypothetical protein
VHAARNSEPVAFLANSSLATTVLLAVTAIVGGGQNERPTTSGRSTTMSITTTYTSPANRAGRARNDEPLLTDDALAKVTAIAFEEVPGGRILEVEIDPDAHSAYEVHMLNADGVPTMVYIDGSFDYVGIG